jgi:hypothetical protein
MTIADFDRLEFVAAALPNNLHVSQRTRDTVTYFWRPATIAVAIAAIRHPEYLCEQRSIRRLSVCEENHVVSVLQPTGAVFEQASNKG